MRASHGFFSYFIKFIRSYIMNKTKRLVFCIVAALAVILLVVLSCLKLDFDVTETAWALFPPVLAIALALITKEAYSSLLMGVLAGCSYV